MVKNVVVFQTFFTEKGSEKLETFSPFCEFEVKNSKGTSKEVKRFEFFTTFFSEKCLKNKQH
jgi:hypothetical protein